MQNTHRYLHTNSTYKYPIYTVRRRYTRPLEQPTARVKLFRTRDSLICMSA